MVVLQFYVCVCGFLLFIISMHRAVDVRNIKTQLNAHLCTYMYLGMRISTQDKTQLVPNTVEHLFNIQ